MIEWIQPIERTKIMQQKPKIDRKKVVRRVILVLLVLLLIILIKRVVYRQMKNDNELTSSRQTEIFGKDDNNINSNIPKNELEDKPVDKITVVLEKENELLEGNKEDEKKEVELDWNLLLVNTNNKMPDGYKVQLGNIDQYRSLDIRAIQHLTQMINDIRYAGITNIWIQSAYRKPEDQEILFEKQVQAYIYQGYSEKSARELTEKIINKPWHSEHNLGLAVDFNYVNREFENTAAFQWLQENAQNYGFILRYEEEKEEITKVSYEPWHWRYVGEEHAKKMKEQNLCLEEYIEKITN